MVFEISFTYISSVLSRVSNYATGVLGLNLHYGYAGLFNLGMTLFYIVGAYTAAILVTKYQLDFLFVLAAAMVLAAVLAYVVGVISFRTRGDYFGIVMLGLVFVAYSFMLNWNAEPIRGALGIPSIKRPEILGFSFNTFESFFVLSLGILALVFVLSSKIVNSPYGRVLKSLRDDEEAAMSLGKDISKYKLSIFIIGAVFASISGVLYAYWSTYVEPRPFGVLDSVFILFAVIIGGKGNLFGSVLGAFIVIALPEPLRFINLPAHVAGGIRQLLLGIITLAIVLYKSEGLLPEKVRHFTLDSQKGEEKTKVRK